MKDLYLKITDQLTNAAALAKYQAKGIDAIKYIDTYKNQYFAKNKFEAYLLPAAFVQWQIDHKTGNTLITIHIEYEQQRDTSNKSLQQPNALKFFDLIDVVNELLYHLESATTSKLILTGENSVREDTIECVYTLNYECQYTGKEEPAACQWQWTNENEVEPVVDGVIVKELE